MIFIDAVKVSGDGKRMNKEDQEET